MFRDFSDAEVAKTQHEKQNEKHTGSMVYLPYYHEVQVQVQQVQVPVQVQSTIVQNFIILNI